MAAGFAPDAVLTECEGAMDALGALSGRSVREDVTQAASSRASASANDPLSRTRGCRLCEGSFKIKK